MHVNALEVEREEVENKILFLCVEKYQQTKIRRQEVVNMVNGLFLLSGTQDKQKEYFMKLVVQEIDLEHVNVCTFAKMLYATVVYLAMKHEIDQLDRKLSDLDLHIGIEVLQQYLQTVGENVSM